MTGSILSVKFRDSKIALDQFLFQNTHLFVQFVFFVLYPKMAQMTHFKVIKMHYKRTLSI